MEQVQTKSQLKRELIYLMVDLGYRILTINKRIYIAKAFTPAEDNVAYHTLKGNDITKILDSFPNYRNMDKNQIEKMAQKIETAQKVHINFSRNQEWNLYLP